MNSKLKLLIFCLKNLPKFFRLCAQLLEEWYKFEKCQNDEVGII